MLIICPHCGRVIEILEINCGIFRCGIFKDNLQQINPHLSKIECEKLLNTDTIIGCSKPFRVTENGVVEICEYI